MVNIRSTNVIKLFNELKGVLLEKMYDFTQRGSGWILDSIYNLGIHTIKYVPASGKSYIPLPTKLSNTKAIVNIMNNDNQCFKWAVTRALNPVKDHAYRVSGELRKQSELLNWTDIVFLDMKMVKLYL
jgi:hypothetical protein